MVFTVLDGMQNAV